jgi:DNA-binding response OmpR family regulator
MSVTGPQDSVNTTSILIVDDDLMVLELIKEAFEMFESEVFIANNGLDGLDLFNKKQPDIVLTDIQMPGMDGAELAGRIREHSPEAVIAVMTGGFVDVGNELVKNGIADHFFQKPLNIMYLYKALTADLQLA